MRNQLCFHSDQVLVVQVHVVEMPPTARTIPTTIYPSSKMKRIVVMVGEKLDRLKPFKLKLLGSFHE
jgi:hypothetical protein